jgi:serine/threonine protein kinase
VHDHAYFNANVLHRDISVGNILINEEGKGLLIDWDLCVRVDPNSGNRLTSRRPPDRTVSIYLFARGPFLIPSSGDMAIYVCSTPSGQEQM